LSFCRPQGGPNKQIHIFGPCGIASFITRILSQTTSMAWDLKFTEFALDDSFDVLEILLLLKA
jgi:hypothetical protein